MNAFEGLVWGADGRSFYVSGGPDDLVHVFRQKAEKWAESTSIALNHHGLGLGLYGIYADCRRDHESLRKVKAQ